MISFKWGGVPKVTDEYFVQFRELLLRLEKRIEFVDHVLMGKGCGSQFVDFDAMNVDLKNS